MCSFTSTYNELRLLLLSKYFRIVYGRTLYTKEVLSSLLAFKKELKPMCLTIMYSGQIIPFRDRKCRSGSLKTPNFSSYSE